MLFLLHIICHYVYNICYIIFDQVPTTTYRVSSSYTSASDSTDATSPGGRIKKATLNVLDREEVRNTLVNVEPEGQII
jgi:hypothetical protein